VDECATSIQSIQLLKGNAFVDNDQYYYDGGYKYAFNYAGGDTFSDLLPITLRIALTGGEVILLEDIITDLNGGSVFTSNQICEAGDDDTGVDTPAPVIAQTPSPTLTEADETDSPTMAEEEDTPAPTNSADESPEVTPDPGNGSGAVRGGQFVAVAVACALFFSFM